MKVAATKGPGLARTAAACIGIAVAVAVGSSLVPMPAASAYVGGPDFGGSERDELVLAPVVEPQKADEIRQPSGLGEVEAAVSSALTPTRVRRASVRATRGAVVASAAPTTDGWRRARVSWYGPGFIGDTMAGGGTLQWDSMVVAHRSLPFGTRIEFSYNGNTCVAVVADRGPYAGGRIFDLGPGTAAALGFGGVGTVEYRILY